MGSAISEQVAFDVSFARSHFPALHAEGTGEGGGGDGWALFDNAGGSVAPRQVIDRVGDYMRRFQVQLGATYELSRDAGERVAAGRRAVATLIHARPEEVVLGASTTLNAHLLARALRPSLKPGDEIVVTNLDHEANIGAWRRLEAEGMVLREWRFSPDTLALEPEDLDALLTERTRLVCFTHCSNLVGAFHDVAAICRRVRAAGALSVVDGVAFAPHRRVDVEALGADFYLLSLYKVYGPHLGVLYARGEHLERLASQGHVFLGDDLAHRLEPGGPNHELAASLPGILDYLAALDRHHFDRPASGWEERLGRTFEMLAAHEEALAEPLLEFLSRHRGVRLLGPASAARGVRAPTVSFVVPGRDSGTIPPLLDARRLAARWGHFYAWRAVRDLGLLPRNGVVRVSMAHYNTPREVRRLIRALDEVL